MGLTALTMIKTMSFVCHIGALEMPYFNLTYQAITGTFHVHVLKVFLSCCDVTRPPLGGQ